MMLLPAESCDWLTGDWVTSPLWWGHWTDRDLPSRTLGCARTLRAASHSGGRASAVPGPDAHPGGCSVRHLLKLFCFYILCSTMI